MPRSAGILTVLAEIWVFSSILKKLRGFGTLANYADRATAACWPSSANFCG
jgi:hypothetical protein